MAVKLDKTATRKELDGRLFVAQGRQLYVLQPNGSLTRYLTPGWTLASETLVQGYLDEALTVSAGTGPFSSRADGQFDVWFPDGNYDLYAPGDATNKIVRWQPSAAAGVQAQLDARALKSNLFINVRDAPYNAVPGQDCTQAFMDAAATGRRMFVPAHATLPYYLTAAPQPNGIFGEDDSLSRIVQNTASAAVIIANGEGFHCHDLALEHASLPTGQTAPNGVGIRIRKIGDRSVFERLKIANSTVAIYSKEAIAPDATSSVFSTRFSDMRLRRFTRGGMELHNEGDTGCVISNIYLENWDAYPTTKLTAKFGFSFGNFEQLECEQLNVEHGIYENALLINSCRTFSLNGLHCEGYEANAAFTGVIQVIGVNTKVVELDGLNLLTCTVDAARTTDYALIRIDDSPIVLLGRFQASATIKTGTPTMRRFYCPTASSTARIYTDAWSLDANWPNSNDSFATAGVLRRSPDNWDRFRQADIDGTAGAGYLGLIEQTTDPAAPATDGGRLFIRDNGSGKTQLCVRFATGAVQVIATQP